MTKHTDEKDCSGAKEGSKGSERCPWCGSKKSKNSRSGRDVCIDCQQEFRIETKQSEEEVKHGDRSADTEYAELDGDSDRGREADAGTEVSRIAYDEIKRMSSSLEVPSYVSKTAVHILRQAYNEGMPNVFSDEAIATAALYTAILQEDAPWSLSDVVDVSRVERSEITSTYRVLRDRLELAIEPVAPSVYVGRWASQLNFSQRTQQIARQILEAAESQGLHSGVRPTSLAAAALYLAGLLASELKSQQEVSEVTGVGESTISKHYWELVEELNVDRSCEADCS